MTIDQKTSSLPGPFFEAGPGWGERINCWLKKNFFIRLLPTIIFALVLIIVAKTFSHPHKPLASSPPSPLPSLATIAVTVETGDGVIALTRRALTQYLIQTPGSTSSLQATPSLSPGEKLAIDNFFKEKYRNQVLAVGQKIDFLAEDFRQAIAQARQLSPHQRQEFEKYLPR